jgi:hypothetical protein
VKKAASILVTRKGQAAPEKGSRVCMQVTKLHHDLEEAIHTNTQLLADSSARQVELKGKEEELAGLRVEILKVIKVRPGV